MMETTHKVGKDVRAAIRGSWGEDGGALADFSWEEGVRGEDAEVWGVRGEGVVADGCGRKYGNEEMREGNDALKERGCGRRSAGRGSGGRWRAARGVCFRCGACYYDHPGMV